MFMRYTIQVGCGVTGELHVDDEELARKIMKALADLLDEEVTVYDRHIGGIIASSEDAVAAQEPIPHTYGSAHGGRERPDLDNAFPRT